MYDSATIPVIAMDAVDSYVDIITSVHYHNKMNSISMLKNSWHYIVFPQIYFSNEICGKTILTKLQICVVILLYNGKYSLSFYFAPLLRS